MDSRIERGKELFLAHYSSQYYDPVKAHEYYEKNKELKGPQPAAPKNETKEQREARKATSQRQREGLSYAKKQIGNAKQVESKSAQAAQELRMKELRGNAEMVQQRIQEKLAAKLEEIRVKAVNSAKRTVVKAKPLNPIPANASPQLKAYLQKQNEQITKSNKAAQQKADADYAKAKGAAQASAASANAAAKTAAQAEMKKVGTDLKAMVTKARKDYAAAGKARTAKYKAAVDAEEKNIKANVK